MNIEKLNRHFLLRKILHTLYTQILQKNKKKNQKRAKKHGLGSGASLFVLVCYSAFFSTIFPMMDFRNFNGCFRCLDDSRVL